MTTPTLTSTMFENTSHLGLSVPHKTAMIKVATGTAAWNVGISSHLFQKHHYCSKIEFTGLCAYLKLWAFGWTPQKYASKQCFQTCNAEKQKFKTKKKFELSCLDSWYNHTKKKSTTLQFLNVGIAFVPKSEEVRHSTTGNLNRSPCMTT